MKSVLGIIIAFDNDNDLRELTEHRTVAAVQWGGRYRIVDFMLSNMVNSGIYRVGILMKDKYQSLIDHVGNVSGASALIALNEALCEGKLQPGDIACMTAFGGGLTAGSCVIRI